MLFPAETTASRRRRRVIHHWSMFSSGGLCFGLPRRPPRYITSCRSQPCHAHLSVHRPLTSYDCRPLTMTDVICSLQPCDQLVPGLAAVASPDLRPLLAPRVYTLPMVRSLGRTMVQVRHRVTAQYRLITAGWLSGDRVTAQYRLITAGRLSGD